uniref:Uncharacterized protein n=1 Tax=viral metagenome TaxID=1070528 RepID=A0A6C0K476_9ZZZZ
MNGLQGFLMGVVILILILIIIAIVLGSIASSQFMTCSKNVAILLDCTPNQANTFLKQIVNSKVSMTTYRNICKIAQDAATNSNSLDDIKKLLLNLNISDYQKIIKAMDVAGIEKQEMPRRAVSLQSTPIPSYRPIMNYK